MVVRGRGDLWKGTDSQVILFAFRRNLGWIGHHIILTLYSRYSSSHVKSVLAFIYVRWIQVQVDVVDTSACGHLASAVSRLFLSTSFQP
jgi:hypothetical protein